MNEYALREDFDPPLDSGIERAVLILRREGIHTYESCQGGKGHSYPEPAVRFEGDHGEEWRALGVAIYNGLPVKEIRRVWSVIHGQPEGPVSEIVFWEQVPLLSNHRKQ